MTCQSEQRLWPELIKFIDNRVACDPHISTVVRILTRIGFANFVVPPHIIVTTKYSETSIYPERIEELHKTGASRTENNIRETSAMNPADPFRPGEKLDLVYHAQLRGGDHVESAFFQ